MKNVIFFLSLMILLGSCSGQDSSKNVQKTIKSNTKLTKQDACDFISKAEVGQLFGESEDQLVENDVSYYEDEDLSICSFLSKESMSEFRLRLHWMSDNGIENKTLEKSYPLYLTSGDKKIKKYEEVYNSDNVQIVYGVKDDRFGTFNHRVRKRIGNTLEITINVMLESEDKSMKEQLLKIIQRIH